MKRGILATEAKKLYKEFLQTSYNIWIVRGGLQDLWDDVIAGENVDLARGWGWTVAQDGSTSHHCETVAVEKRAGITHYLNCVFQKNIILDPRIEKQ